MQISSIKNQKSLLFTTFLIFLLINQINSKVMTSSVTLVAFRRNGGWNFVDRINVNQGNLEVDVVVRLTTRNNMQGGGNYFAELAIVSDNVWKYQSQNKCNKGDLTQLQKQELAKSTQIIPINLTTQNSHTYKIQLSLPVPFPTTYHLVLKDCKHSLVRQQFSKNARFETTIDVRNNGMHIGQGQSYYGWILPVLIGLIYGMIWWIRKDKQQEGQNWIKFLLKFSIWCSFISITFKYIGYIIYYTSGSDYSFFDFTYLFFHSSSDAIVIVILILVSYGWTITFKKTKDFDLYVPLVAMLGLVNVIMTLLNKVTDGQHDKYHMYDTIPAYILIFFKMLGLLVFIIGITKSLLQLNSKTYHKQKQIFHQLGLIGIIYLSIVPLSIYFITFINANYRKQLMFFVIEIIKNVLNVVLIYVCGNKRSSYRQLLEKSFMEKGDKFY